MKRLLFSTIILAGILSSCSIVKTTPRTLNTFKSNIIIKPLVAEVEVDINKKIEATAVVTRKQSIDDAKEMAKWNALERSGADIIVDPVYHITIGNNITATVTGYFGRYVKIETVDNADIDNLNLYLQQENSSSGSGSVVSKLRKLKNKN